MVTIDSEKNHQWSQTTGQKLVGFSAQIKEFPHRLLINYKVGEMTFTAEKPGRYYVNK